MQPGTIVAERFELLAEVGAGGMGRIFRARDRFAGGVVAVKTILGASEDASARFLREARLLAELRHPHVVRYLQHGMTPEGTLYLVMDWLEGEDLAARLRRGPLGVRASAELGARVADALGAAHARGIVHRDVKPANLFLRDGDPTQVTVLDFGIARSFDESATRVTVTGAWIGTPGYMAPEQARGDVTLDARADVFALGCVLYECLSGRGPFNAPQAVAALARILLEDPAPLGALRPTVPPELARAVEAMLAKDRTARPVDGRAVRLLLEALALPPDEGDGDELASARTQAARARDEVGTLPAVTRAELRVIPVLLLADPDVVGQGTAPTLPARSEAERLEALREIAARHGGRLERLRDGTLAVVLLGSGSARDRAHRAARCALALLDRAPAAAAALATGRTTGSEDAPIGEALERAVQLLDDGRRERDEHPGLVRLDELTAGLLEEQFEIGRDGSGPHLLRERDVLGTSRSLLGRATPCVGRDDERAMLDRTWRTCTTEPTARAVLVTAPPGTGKSRLLREFLSGLGDAARVTLIGRGDPTSAGAPLALLAQAIRREIGILEGEAASEQEKKLRARVAARVPAADQPRVAAFLGELVRVPLDDEGVPELRAARRDRQLLGDQMKRALCDWLAAESDAAPVLIVLEDLHWGDLPSIEYVDAALRELAERPLMMLALARPEVHEAFPALFSGRELQEHRLAPLSRRAAERLVRAVLGAAAQGRVARIVERAGGNAFFLEELIRAEVDGRGDELPDGILALLQSRLSQLDPEARRRLRAASVFGERFWTSGVGALLGEEDAARTQSWLDELERRELVVRRVEGRFPGTTEYVFRHGLVRDAAYATLPDDQRAPAHGYAARWLMHAGERDARVLALHFDRAGDAVVAARHYASAARQSIDAPDWASALACATRSLELDPEGPSSPDALRWKAEAHRVRAEATSAAEAGRRAMEAYPEGSSGWYGSGAVWLHSLGELGELPRAIELGQRLASTTPSESALRDQALACGLASQVVGLAGFGEVADGFLTVAEAAEARLAELDPAVRVGLALARSRVHLFAGESAQMMVLLRDIAPVAREAGLVRQSLSVDANLMYAYFELGDFEKSESLARELGERGLRLGSAHWHAWASLLHVVPLARLGRLAEAEAVARAALELPTVKENDRMLGNAQCYLAEVLRLSGNLPAAEAEARRAAETLKEQHALRPTALAILARTLASLGRPAEALAAAREGYDVLESIGQLDGYEAEVRVCHAELLHDNGEVAEARRVLGIAHERLLARAAGITDAELQTCFLQRVPEHRRTLELAAAWGLAS